MNFYSLLLADKVHKLGWKILNSLYPQMIDIAKATTNEANETKAVVAMRAYLNSSEMFFNTEPFPANESDQNAHIMCRSLESKYKTHLRGNRNAGDLSKLKNIYR